MRNSAAKCDRQRGVVPTTSTTVASASPFYSEAAHRAIIALRCATSHRPFNFVNDKYYHKEVELLRPGTKIPAPTTVSLDIKHIYLELSKTVRMYFKVQVHLYCIWSYTHILPVQNRNRAVHLAIDGWTSPLTSSYLGVVVIWYEAGKIHRAILEFLRCVVLSMNTSITDVDIFWRLTESHDGKYLAARLAECLVRFGLDDYVRLFHKSEMAMKRLILC